MDRRSPRSSRRRLEPQDRRQRARRHPAAPEAASLLEKGPHNQYDLSALSMAADQGPLVNVLTPSERLTPATSGKPIDHNGKEMPR